MEKYHRTTVEYWKQNAKENYLTTPISVLKYITVLEEQNQALRQQLEQECYKSGEPCKYNCSGLCKESC